MSNDFLRAIVKDNFKREATRSVYQRGLNYYQSKRVELISESNDHLHLHVRGSHYSEYCVDIYGDATSIIYECTCPASYTYSICKHVVAALLFLETEAKRAVAPQQDNKWREKMDSLMRVSKFYGAQKPRTRKAQLLFLSLQPNSYGYGHQLIPYAINHSFFPSELIDQEDGIDNAALTHHLVENAELTHQFKEVKSADGLTQFAYLNVEEELLTIIESGVEYSGYYNSSGTARRLNALRRFDAPLFYGRRERPFQNPLTVHSDEAAVYLDLTESKSGIQLSVQASVGTETLDLHQRGTEVFGSGPYWILTKNILAKCAPDYQHHLVQQILANGKVLIPKEQKSFFVNQYLLPIMTYLPLGGTAVIRHISKAPLTAKQLYLEEENGELTASLQFKYGDHSVPHTHAYPYRSTQLDENDSSTDQLTLIELERDPEQEEAIYRDTSSALYGLKYGPKDRENLFVLRARVDPIDFLLKKMPNLVADGYEIFGEEKLKSVRVNRNTPTISFNVSSGIDWFDIRTLIQFGDVPVPLKAVRQSLRNKERFVKLADGTIGEIPEEWLQKYRHLFQFGEQDGENIRLSNHHVTLLDKLLAEADQAQVDAEYQERLGRLQSFERIEPQPVPDGFVGELRPYQKAGHNWLHFLHEFNFGGCLADDMGLGKTIQVLTLLQSHYEQESHLPPSLIVLPRSLLVNWEREAARFTPGLKLMTHFGQTRANTTAAFNTSNLILTTYGVVRRDVQMLRQFEFHYIILDESQAIKNPNAKISKSVRLLNSRHRLAMTGTPVENSTFELWSQFAFLNPGLLGGVDYFRSEFSNPIEKYQDKEAANLLRQMVYPFILRRTKAQVALDLPPRTDRVVYVEMGKAQRKLYDKTRDDYRAQLLGVIQEEGMNAARFKILEGLLRLRQICNHPKLVKPKFRGDSAKLELLLDTMETLQQEGHKALVFSQFVQMLKIIEEEMKKRGMRYTYLDGSTRNRQERVDTFQNDPDLTFFLISLKAGGVGLNLTAADYVIHVDPWWNPAVEMQASDRSHRIGQDKPVFVYKLITKGSVEEKILELQQRKQALVEQLITSEGGMLKQLTADDVQVLFS